MCIVYFDLLYSVHPGAEFTDRVLAELPKHVRFAQLLSHVFVGRLPIARADFNSLLIPGGVVRDFRL